MCSELPWRHSKQLILLLDFNSYRRSWQNIPKRQEQYNLSRTVSVPNYAPTAARDTNSTMYPANVARQDNIQPFVRIL